jgi:hypothetical protein
MRSPLGPSVVLVAALSLCGCQHAGTGPTGASNDEPPPLPSAPTGVPQAAKNAVWVPAPGKQASAQPPDDIVDELQIALAHAEAASKGGTLASVRNDLGQLLNCLVGPKGEGFDASVPNPCASLGVGLDSATLDDDGGLTGSFASQEVDKAAKLVRAGLAAKTLAAARDKGLMAGAVVSRLLALKEAEEFGMLGLLNGLPNPSCATAAVDSGSGGDTGLVRQAKVVVKGSLPSEVVQKIVRRQFGIFQASYRQGLRSNPSLEGRVIVNFVIDRSGAVSTCADGGSDLPDQGVVQCIVQTFCKLVFPTLESGSTSGSYAIVLSPTVGR